MKIEAVKLMRNLRSQISTDIEGMKWDEGRELIDRLNDHATQDRFTYRHSWKTGDMILWDNRAALHRGLAFNSSKHKRRLHRTTIAGTNLTLNNE